MKLLVLDTSTDTASVALLIDDAVHERVFRANNAHGEQILPVVGELLASQGLALEACDAIAFAHGPGSFTGLRIACGVAQGLALGAGLRVYGIDTLLALAAASGGERVLAVLDARMHEVYFAAYEKVGEEWLQRLPPTVASPSAVVLPDARDWLGVGNGFDAYPEIAKCGAPRLRLAACASPPLAAAVARLAAARAATTAGLPPDEAWPLYVRNKVALTTAERALGASADHSRAAP